MKENKKFLEFADGHLEEILLYKKGESNRAYPIAITKKWDLYEDPRGTILGEDRWANVCDL